MDRRRRYKAAPDVEQQPFAEIYLLLLSLAGVKGPSRCAVRQNSKSDPI
jgi:hypothetical protein